MDMFLRILFWTFLFWGWGEGSNRWKALIDKANSDVDEGQLERRTPYHLENNPAPYEVVHLEPQYFPELNSKRVQIKYGPFEVESMAKTNGMVDYLQIGAHMPCRNCTITYMAASMEYPDGSYANANTSLWLHHIVLINMGRADAVCGHDFHGERFFASGNERTPAAISRMGTMPTGYFLGPWDAVILLVELMNQAMGKQTAVPTIIFEYIEGFPAGFYPLKPVWLDITGCGGSDMPPKTNTTFEYSSPGWNANFSGAIVGMGGHVHDGGTHLEIFENDKEICNCVASYGQSPGYWDAPGTSMVMPMTPDFSRMEHVSSISGCLAPTAEINPGDNLHIKAFYNFTEYMPMLNVDGKYADIMGISMLYVAEGMTKSKMESYVGSHVLPLEKTPEPTNVAAMDMSMPKGVGPDMGQMVMTCVPSRDSPGTITTKGINMSIRRIAMDYLMAILNDTCLQVWSNEHVKYFWYGIVVVIGLFTLARLLQWTKLASRKRNAAAGRHDSAALSIFSSKAAGALRAVSYPQYTPSKIHSILKIPTSGTLFMILGYAGFLMALEFINTSTGDNQTYQFLAVQAAWLSVGQIPLIVLLASKRNFIEILTAVTYERLNVLHRWTARGLLLTTTMHFGFASYGWARAGVMQLEWSTDTCPPSGMACYAIVLWMNLSTLAPFRNFRYEFFVIQHIITFLGLIIAIMIHIPPTALYARTYIYIAIGLYLFSRLVQTAIYAYHNINPSRAKASAISNGVTKITIKHRNLSSWRPGSFILLSIPRYGIFQSHPATIASTPTSHDGDLVFFLRKHTGFTKKIARGSSHIRDHIALIDGPYGGRQSDFAAFHSVVLIAGSTGVTFTLPILLDIATRAAGTKLPVQELHFVWAMKDQPFIASLQSDLKKAFRALRAAGVSVYVHVHVTGAYEPQGSYPSSTEKSETSSNDSSSDVVMEEKDIVQARVGSGSDSIGSKESAIAIASGRPHVQTILRSAKAQSAGEMGVAVCGPLSLSTEVRNTVSGMTLAGEGVYLHVEGFGW